MRASFLFLFLLLALSFCFFSCDEPPSPQDGEKEEGTEEVRDDSDDDYLDITPVSVELFEKYTLVFNEGGIHTLLPRDWEVLSDNGKYTLTRGGKTIGSAESGSVAHTHWRTVNEKEFEIDGGLLLLCGIEKQETEDAPVFRHRLTFSFADEENAIATFFVDYEQLDASAIYHIWRETLVAERANAPTTDALFDVFSGDSVLILGNSFIHTSRIGTILTEMCKNAPYPIEVTAVSRGYAEVGTYTGDAALMQEIRRGEYGCVFICGFYGEGQVENLGYLVNACQASSTPLVVFPAHNENASVVERAVAAYDGIHYLPWREEINALIASGVDYWDMCINDGHRHSKPMAGYVGAHMIYRTLFLEMPKDVSVAQFIEASDVRRTLGESYLRTGVVCKDAGKKLWFH